MEMRKAQPDSLTRQKLLDAAQVFEKSLVHFKDYLKYLLKR
jgi:hypothetical protein